MPARPPPRPSDLMRIHPRLDEAFESHQLALLRGDLEDARRAFDDFEALLRAHMADEERWVLPLYAERMAAKGAPPGGGPELFHKEHQKLLSSLEALRSALGNLGPDDLRARLSLLEQEYAFKQLLSHHDAREGSLLYPALDALLSEAEARELFAHLTLPPEPEAR
ncbi:MAG: hemerythrin domain-containing protein [Deltaproteobacteria bacterium]|nr:MAG: hemerythrin domain-containing protein [Deltaproteobacteria bacterium]